jgi:hypothetical protein
MVQGLQESGAGFFVAEQCAHGFQRFRGSPRAEEELPPREKRLANEAKGGRGFEESRHARRQAPAM